MRIKLGKLLAVVLAACMTLSSVSLSALMDPDKLPSEGGELANYSYTLTEDIDLTGGYIVTHDVTIDLNGHTIKNVMEKTRVNDGDLTMFTVRNGATLTINDSSAKDGTLDQNLKNDRTIRVDGSGYYDGIKGQWIDSPASSLTINGGEFVNSTDGVVYANGSGVVVTLNGGTLKENTTPGNGGAICVDGGGTFIMNGGTVDNNKSLRDANEDWGKIGGGGIYVLGNMTMSGGTVSNNTAGAGGGIFVNANWHDHGAPCDYIFKMSGGTVTGNVANKIEGGGIRIGWFVEAEFKADPGKYIHISYNQTTSDTDWGGGGIFVSEDGKATMYDVLITDNSSKGLGGGLTGCPTAHNYVMSTDGAAIYDNSALGLAHVAESTKDDSPAYDDTTFMRPGAYYQDYYCNLKSIISDTMLGGGSERWVGTIDSEEVTFGPGETRVSAAVSGLTADPTYADRQLAESRAKIYVQNNQSATHGGGILNNGMLFFGETPDGYVPTYFSIPVKKSITGADNLDITDKFTFNLELVSVVSKKTANDEVIGDVPFEAYKDSVTVVGAAEGRFKSIQFTDPDNKLQVGASGYSDNYLTYTFEVREVEYQPAEGEPDNQYEYTLDNTVWRVEADVIAEAIGDPDIESMFNVNRYLTVREIRLYKNDETLPADTVTNATHNGGTITADKGFIASFNNTLGTGDLKVEKKTVIENENGVENYETTEKFSFTVTLDKPLNGTFGDMEFKDGEATFDLRNGEHKTAAGLPIGVKYTVTEADNDKYESSLSTNSVGTIDEETLDDETNTVTVTATNTVKTGSLSITKTLKGNAPGADTKEFKFTVTGPDGYENTVTITGENTLTLNNLAIGEYTVTEQDANIDGYTLKVTGSGTTETVTVDKMAEFDITNKYTQKLGSLKITKKLAGDKNEDIENKTFTFTVTGPDGYNETVTIIGEGEETLNDLVPGEYTITEQDANIDGYTLEVSGDTTATVTAEKVVNATITNTYHKLGSLKIVKSVVGGGDEAANKTFTFTVTGPDGYNETVTIIGEGEEVLENLVPGEYTVTEDKTSAQINGYTLAVTGEGKATVSAEDVANVTIVNTYTQKPGSLKITKTLKGEVDAAKGKTFSFTITGEGVTKNVTVEPGKTVEVKDLVPGTYTITETGAEVEGYTLTVTGIDDPVTVAADQVTEVNVTNTYTQKPGSLKIVKSVEGGGEEAANKTFTFTVTGPDEFSKTVTITGNGYAELENLVPGDYTVTEDKTSAQISGYTLTVDGEGKATVSAEDVANVTIVNTYTQKLGSLKIVKSVVGGGEEAANKTFTFTVTGTNYSKTVTITGNGYAELENLVPGEYTVTENKTSAQINGYTLAVTGEGKATVSAEDVANVTIVNTYTQKPGSLKIVKSVVGGGDEAANKTFTFTVTGPDEFSNTVTITGNGYAELENLVPGEYTVTEQNADIDGYTLEVTGNGETKTVTADQVAEFDITNTYTQKPGSLRIVKTLSGEVDAASDKTFTFTVTGPDGYNETVTVTGAGTVTLDNLVPGDYTVTEDKASAQITGYTLAVTGEGKATVSAEEVANVTIVNTYTQKLGSLKITKKLAGAVDAASDKTFTFTVTGPNYSNTVTITGNGYAELENLVPGEYKITEQNADIEGYTLEVTGNGETKTVTADQVAEFYITNTYTQKLGSLKIVKSVVGGGEEAANKTFTFTVTGPDEFSKTVTINGEGEETLNDLVPGEYKITEQNADIDGYTLEVSGNTTATVTAEKVANATITNTYHKLGSLKIVKSVEGGGDEAANKTFTFTVTGTNYSKTVTIKGNGETKLDNLVPGEYKITETGAEVEGYTLTVTGIDKPVTVVADQVTEVNVTNTYTQKPGSLKIAKSVVGGGDEAANKTFTFTVTGPNYSNTVTIIGTGEETLNDLVPGEYKITEQNADIDGYTLEVTGNGETKTVTADQVAEFDITNEYTQKLGSLKIVKSVVGGGEEAANKTFTFTVTGTNYSKTVTITGNGEKKLDNLVPGEYTVTEQNADIDGYTLEVTGNGETKTVTADQVAEFDITNTYTQKLGSLKIVKSVVGGGDDAAGKTFTFTVTGPNYSKTVTIIGTGEAVLENLVPGTYTVTEDTASAEVEGYTLTVTGDNSTATIAADGNAEVTITNNYTRKVGDLSVTKTLAGPVTDEDMAGSYNITVTLTNADGSVYDGNYTLSGADYEYSVPISLVFTGFTSDSKNKTIQISGLPVGTRYTVTEAAVDETFNVSYTAVTGDGVVTADSVSGSISEALSMATVTNTKKETERFALNVTKTVEGAVPAEPFKFNVTFYIKTAEGITAPAGAVLGADGAGNITYAFEIPANTTVSFTGVPKGTYYEITEAPAEGYTLINQSLTSGTLLGNAEATFVNKENVRGSLSIVKELIGEGNALNAYNVNVTLTYPDERGVVSEVVTLTPGMPKIYEDLPVGTAFEVSETAESADGYNVSVSINGGGYVPGAAATGTVTETAPVVSVAVRNEKEAPKESSLTVIKTVRGDNIDPTRAFNFTVTLTDTTINGVYGEMEFVNGVASFALAGGQSRSADKLPEGIGYTVKELDENLDGYTTEYPANATGILSSDSSAIVEVINTTSTLPGSLSVTKQVTGNGAEMGRTFMFTVMLNDPTITGQYGDMYFNGGVATIYLAHGMRATATGLPAGVGYNVIENDYGDYIPQAINPTGVIPDNGSAEVVYINHRDEQLGSLSVSKTVEGEGYDPEQEFTFTVTINDPTVNGQYGDMFFSGGVATLTLKAGQTATATNLPADTGYTVTEAPVENYTSAATGDVGIIPAGNGAYAQFVNTYEAPKVGGFSLMKIVSGTAADPNRYFTFQVILSDATINGVYGDLAFADGFSTVFLRHGDIVYCDNLPEGTGYTVIELDADDYEVSCNAPAGTIVSGETGEIIFENHKDVPPPPPEIPENEENPHGDDLNAGVGGDRDRHGDDMNAGVGMDDMNPATGDFMSESFMNGMAMLSAIVAAIAAFGAAVLIRKRKKD